MYYIYRADCQQKVLLNEVPATVPTKVKKHDNEPILRVGRGEQASRLSERVIRGAVRHFEMPSHMGAVRAARQARDVIPPAVFEESQTGVVRVVYKEVVIRFGSKVDRKRRKQILDKHNLKIRRKNPIIRDQVVTYVKDRTQAGDNIIEIANDCAEMDETIFATPNFISQYRRNLLVPLIPVEQWHLYNLGNISGQSIGEDVNARHAWKITQGKSSITIAVLDDGVDIEHLNLRSNIKKNPDPKEPHDKYGRDFFVPETDPDHFDPRPKLFQWPYDQLEGNDIHGTPCAGVIASAGKDAFGIAPKCSILPVKIFHADELATDERVANAIRYAALHADIISCSWTGAASPDIEFAIEDAGQIGRAGKGSAVFCASGNNFLPFFTGMSVQFPAAFDEAIAVGASTDQGKRAVYSRYGPELWIVAPSNGGKRGIYTTDVSYYNRGLNVGTDAAGGADGGHINNFGGTSSATPLAAGVAALLLSVKPSLDRDTVKQILADTADKIGDGYDPQTGKSPEYGFGRVNAGAAVDAAQTI